MGVGSDPAGALDKVMCVAGVAALENHFDATEHLTGAPGIDHLAAFDFHFNAQVAFYSGNRINNVSFTH
jgi:hypothetical protein